MGSGDAGSGLMSEAQPGQDSSSAFGQRRVRGDRTGVARFMISVWQSAHWNQSQGNYYVSCPLPGRQPSREAEREYRAWTEHFQNFPDSGLRSLSPYAAHRENGADAVNASLIGGDGRRRGHSPPIADSEHPQGLLGHGYQESRACPIPAASGFYHVS